MKKTLAAIAVLVVLLAAYSVWPFFALYDLARAVQAADVPKIERRVDFPALRRSLSGQIMQMLAQRSGIGIEPTGLIANLASAFANPLIEGLVTPAALAELLKNGWPGAILADRPAGFEGLDPNTLGTAWQLYANSRYGVGTFRMWLPANLPRERQFRIELALSGLTWKLTGLGLPPELLERLARELLKQEKKLGG